MKSSFDKFLDSLNAHNSKSQIALELPYEKKSLEKLLKILPSIILSDNEDSLQQGEKEIWFLILFPSIDINEAVIRLTEEGVYKIKAISPKYSF